MSWPSTCPDAGQPTTSAGVLAGLEGRQGAAALHGLVASDTHGGRALILLRVVLLPHAEGFHGEPILLDLQPTAAVKHATPYAGLVTCCAVPLKHSLPLCT